MTTPIEDWVTAYRRAWETNAIDDIRAAFTEDAIYRMSPSAEPWVGIEAIIAGWLEHQDPPGSTGFESAIVAVDGDVAVVRCVTTYPEGPKGGIYDNLWVIRLAPDGRATEFTDFWVPRPRV